MSADYLATDSGGVIFGTGEPPVDPSEKAPWALAQVGDRWWLQREVIALERQVAAGHLLVHQYCKVRVERLGPFDEAGEAQGYLDALEGR